MPFNLTFVDKAGNAEASALTAAVLVAAAGVEGFCCTVEGVGEEQLGLLQVEPEVVGHECQKSTPFVKLPVQPALTSHGINHFES